MGQLIYRGLLGIRLLMGAYTDITILCYALWEAQNSTSCAQAEVTEFTPG